MTLAVVPVATDGRTFFVRALGKSGGERVLKVNLVRSAVQGREVRRRPVEPSDRSVNASLCVTPLTRLHVAAHRPRNPEAHQETLEPPGLPHIGE